MKRYLGNTGWLLADRLSKMAVTMLVGIWGARHFGPEQFGQLSYALAMVAIFAYFSTCGLANTVPREVLARPLDARSVLQSSLWMVLIGGFLSYLLLTLLNIALGKGVTEEGTFVAVIGLTVLMQMPQIFDAFFQGMTKTHVYAKAGLITNSISIIIKTLLIIADVSPLVFAASFVFDAIILMIVASLFAKMEVKWTEGLFKDRLGEIRALTRISAPYLLSGLLVTVYMKIDQVMIQHMLGSEQVGQYAAAAKLSEVWYTLPAVFVLAIYPAIMNAKLRSQILYHNRLKQLYAILIYSAIVISFTLSMGAELVVDLLYGSKYGEAASVLRIHIWSSVFVFIALASGRWILTENLQLFVMLNTLGGAVINVALNYILLPVMGIDGAAWATVIAYAYSGCFGLLAWKSTRPNFWLLLSSLKTWPFPLNPPAK